MSLHNSKKVFVCGYPVAHSRSPLVHNYWLQKYQISGGYEKIAISPENFPNFLKSFQQLGFIGGNITLPHKETAFTNIDILDEAAKKIGAVNTLWIENGELAGGNTDAYGFTANLDDKVPGWDKNSDRKAVMIVGAGGASRAIMYGLLQRGFSRIFLANRTIEKAEHLAMEFGPHINPVPLGAVHPHLDSIELLINTTSLGMHADDEFPFSIDALPKTALVTDIVYTPVNTGLLKSAKARGYKTIDGLGMLLHQAAPGFQQWFGVKPEVTAKLRKIVEADIENARGSQ